MALTKGNQHGTTFNLDLPGRGAKHLRKDYRIRLLLTGAVSTRIRSLRGVVLHRSPER